MLDMNIHKTNKVVLALKRKNAKARTNAKKVITRLCVKPGSGMHTCFGPQNSNIVYQNFRLSTIPTFNMIRVNQYESQGKISRTL